MLDIQEQLAELRKRVARINHRYTHQKDGLPGATVHRNSHPSIDSSYPTPEELEPYTSRSLIEEWSEGQVVENHLGAHFQTEKLYPAHKRHGSADIGALSELPADLLAAMSDGEIDAAHPERWAFLDTETTGLAGGSGTYAFLIGVGRITPEGFRVRQFFMREYAEEPSQLHALTEHLEQFDTLVTYNGKTFDQPLLETRYRMNRLKAPFGRLPHVDLLHGARRLWKLRYENCRLIHLERQVLGFERQGDLPGELIPYVYFDYLRSREAFRLVPILHHNAIDILTLGCLTAIVPSAFCATGVESLRRLGLRRGEELLGIARWLRAEEEYERASDLFRGAIDAGLPDPLLFRSLWDLALLERKLARPHAAISLWSELATCKNAHQVDALEELAKYYERQERNYAMALEFAQQALQLSDAESLQKRATRLQRKLAGKKTLRLI